MNSGRLKKLRILLVEDDNITAAMESSILIKSGYDVVSVATGEAAIDFLKINHDIDLILMDVDLGDGISGIDTAFHITGNSPIPVIFYTAHDEQDLFLSTADIEKFGYISKNSPKNKVIDIIDNALFINKYFPF